eukprot:TRINITY_DN8620_c0_g2_i1.p1 TRINITY_DN8620_c0_g2~~TRINITY_DN8620_c0_g2_i1.p1  ORF type:complete len:355 (+),score=43.33 TRINITY_DN8620_c0_g2_i1:146-1210(+)
MPYISCLPVGLLATALFLMGLVCGAVWHIVISASTSDEEEAYNNAVKEWEKAGVSFRECEFDICEEGGSCIKMTSVINGDDEGVPPTYQLLRYTSMYYETRLDNELPSNSTRLLRDQKFDPSATVSVFLRSRSDPSYRSESLKIHLFKWHWQYPTLCNPLVGEAWLGEDCVQISVLERICITVNQSESGHWQFSGKYGSDPGCLVNSEAVWDPGAYSFVNSSVVVEGMDQVLIGYRPLPRNRVLSPYRLPKSDWVGDFSLVKIRIRSIYDPIITFENITNGTLSLEDVRIQSPPSTFATYAMLIISIIFLGVSVTIILCLTICFPNHRRYFLFQYESEIPSPHNKLRSLSQIYM